MGRTGHGEANYADREDDPLRDGRSEMTFDEDAIERRHFEEVCDSFRQYATFARCQRANQQERLGALPQDQKRVLPPSLIPGSDKWNERQQMFQEAEVRNQFFFDSMLRYHGQPNSQDVLKTKGVSSVAGQRGAAVSESKTWASDDNISKAQSVLKNLARDWSKEGSEERSGSYVPLLESVQKYIPLPSSHQEGEHAGVAGPETPPPPRLSVPGAGVGRLALELASRGYKVQGNEFSVHMLLASDFLLNACSVDRPYAIAPWIGSTRNVCRSPDPARKVVIPDVDPCSMITGQRPVAGGGDQALGSPAEFSMAAGEFVSIYSKPSERGRWNGVVSCFFLDTAPSIVQYLMVIHDMLVDGGFLINFGPLLWHWSGPNARPQDETYQDYVSRNSDLDQRFLMSVDLSWEDVRDIMVRVGFEVLEENLGLQASYTADSRSLMRSDYRCVHFVAKKRNNL